MVLSTDLIKRSEEQAVKSERFTFRELMLNAGNTAAEIIMQRYDCTDKKITVLCGKGNNGGDGCVIAEVLAQNGADVTVVTPFDIPATENARYYYDNILLAKKSETLPDCSDIIIDALFGIGLDRELNPETAELITKVNSIDAIKIAIDIPSGVSADSGKVLGTAFTADITITFIALKTGLLLPYGSDCCGERIVADIGVKPIDYRFELTKPPVFKKRRHNAHKGDFGTALMLCGSYGMAGAAILSAKAALRSGVGILKAVICDSIYAPFTSSVPEAVCVPVPQNRKGTLSPAYIDLETCLKGISAVLIGCGLSNNHDTEELVKAVCLNSNVPIIIDADGINAIAGSIDIIKKTKAPVILTPHPAEMARLIGSTAKEVEEDRIGTARWFTAEYGCILVLKGADTIIAMPDGKIYFNLTGNPAMATGGSGDVLAGITVSLLAQGLSPEEAAKSAIYLHGLAGDKAAEKRGERAMLPSDIIEEL